MVGVIRECTENREGLVDYPRGKDALNPHLALSNRPAKPQNAYTPF